MERSQKTPAAQSPDGRLRLVMKTSGAATTATCAAMDDSASVRWAVPVPMMPTSLCVADDGGALLYRAPVGGGFMISVAPTGDIEWTGNPVEIFGLSSDDFNGPDWDEDWPVGLLAYRLPEVGVPIVIRTRSGRRMMIGSRSDRPAPPPSLVLDREHALATSILVNAITHDGEALSAIGALGNLSASLLVHCQESADESLGLIAQINRLSLPQESHVGAWALPPGLAQRVQSQRARTACKIMLRRGGVRPEELPCYEHDGDSRDGTVAVDQRDELLESESLGTTPSEVWARLGSPDRIEDFEIEDGPWPVRFGSRWSYLTGLASGLRVQEITWTPEAGAWGRLDVEQAHRLRRSDRTYSLDLETQRDRVEACLRVGVGWDSFKRATVVDQLPGLIRDLMARGAWRTPDDRHGFRWLLRLSRRWQADPTHAGPCLYDSPPWMQREAQTFRETYRRDECPERWPSDEWVLVGDLGRETFCGIFATNDDPPRLVTVDSSRGEGAIDLAEFCEALERLHADEPSPEAVGVRRGRWRLPFLHGRRGR